MMTRTSLAGVMALAILAACSKTEPPQEPAGATATPPAEAAPKMGRAEVAAGLLELLDTAPECQAFRDQLEEAGKTPADVPLEVDAMNQIVAKAHEAGCSKKSAQR